MPITINGTGTITGLIAGGIDDNVITTAEIASAAVTPAKISQPLTLVTTKTASGTAVEFTDIPSWVSRITVAWSGLSTNGTARVILQIGSGSYVTSSYLGSITQGSTAVQAETFSTGFMLDIMGNAAGVRHGHVFLTKISTNDWVFSVTSGRSDATVSAAAGAGSRSLSGALDRVRITTNGSDTFDAGVVNIIYE